MVPVAVAVGIVSVREARFFDSLLHEVSYSRFRIYPSALCLRYDGMKNAAADGIEEGEVEVRTLELLLAHVEEGLVVGHE